MTKDKRDWDVVVLGAGGRQAQAMINAAARQGSLQRWHCVDLSWLAKRRALTESLGATVSELDVLDNSASLRDITRRARVVANMVGPYFRTAGPVLDACIETLTDYMGICDDADATERIMQRDDDARAAHIHALTGMGATPGLSNVLIRAAVDVMGEADKVEICWSVDARDASPAVIEHMWHIFKPWRKDAPDQDVPRWDDLRTRTVDFRGQSGPQLLMELAHSELATIPKFLGIDHVTNFGGIAPADFLVLNWALARLGAGSEGRESFSAIAHEALAGPLAEVIRQPRTMGGIRIDVTGRGRGLRFESASMASMEESTGTPAAAGIFLLLDGKVREPGVSAPECLVPSEFFEKLTTVADHGSSGAMEIRYLHDGDPGDIIRIRDILGRTEALTSRF